MDQSVGQSPDPVSSHFRAERRRCVRHKLHSPVYASFNGSQTGMVVDLSELLDLNEDGFAVQTSRPMEPDRAVSLCLDLPETRSFIHGSGQVIWSDASGRSGIRFSPLSDTSRKILKEWLFANLLIACANHQARAAQLERHTEQPVIDPEPVRALAPGLPSAASQADRLSLLDEVRSEIRELGSNIDAALQLLADRALTLTGASGAALAYLTDDKMVCRARAGDPAPPIGAAVDVTQGLTGECVRTGALVSCQDTEADPRIDPDLGRALGIRSLMASPILSDFRVAGLLEVFSPYPERFSAAEGRILERLGELVPRVRPGKAALEAQLPPASAAESPADSMNFLARPSLRESSASQPAPQPDSEPEAAIAKEESVRQPQPESVAEEPEAESLPAPEAPSRFLYRSLLGLVFVVVTVAVGYLLGPWIVDRWNALTQSQPAQASARESVHVSPKPVQWTQTLSAAELQKLAEQGDADAQWQMAVRHHNGEGVPQDDTQAMKWYERAAEQGHVDAQSHLGAYYWAGRGVPEDLSKAYFWSAIAMAQGDENSKSRLEGLSSQMTRAQITAARQQADAWIHTHANRTSGN